ELGRVLEVILARAPFGLLDPLGRIRLARQIVRKAEGPGDIHPDVARGARGVALVPETGLEVVEGDVPREVPEPAGAVDGVARVADLDRDVVGRGRRSLRRPTD